MLNNERGLRVPFEKQDLDTLGSVFFIHLEFQSAGLVLVDPVHCLLRDFFELSNGKSNITS